MIIIGITGTIGAGKGTIVDFLIEKGFVHYSVRTFITQELNRRGIEVNRDNMVVVANEMRAKNSPSYIIEQLYEQASQSKQNCIIESIRTIGEVEQLKKYGNFCLFAVDAKPALRYNRILERNSETDQITYEVFLENEKREMTSDDMNKQNLSKCISMANYIIENNGTKEELNRKVEEILNDIK
ncbi:MAG: AAA family ATPase [Bacteroidetes bacterium]|nr:AAA family ATPase [Bacteroidota bacterium]